MALFNESAYLSNKIAQLAATGNGSWKPGDEALLKATILGQGFASPADHCAKYGKYEQVSPVDPKYFDSAYAFYALANEGLAGQDPTVAATLMKDGFLAEHKAVIDEYLKAANVNGKNPFIDPSRLFDVEAYCEQLGEGDAAAGLAVVKAAGYATVLEYAVDKAAATPAVTTPYVVATGVFNAYGPNGGAPENEIPVHRDDLSDHQGTDANDAFTAYGPDAFDSNDPFHGEGGTDTLYADVYTSNTVVTPITDSVEIVKFKAQIDSPQGTNGANNLTDAHIDAERLDDVREVWSDGSRANLSVEDVRTFSNLVTVGMADTDPGVNYYLYFDPQALAKDDATTSGVLTLQVIDNKGSDEGDQPLLKNVYNEVTFTLDGTHYTVHIADTQAGVQTELENKAAYDWLAGKIEAATVTNLVTGETTSLAALGISVSVPNKFESSRTVDNVVYNGEGWNIVLESSRGTLAYHDDDGLCGWATTGVQPASSALNAEMKTVNTTDCPLIRTIIALDNVGRVQWTTLEPDNDACLPDDIIYGSNAGDMIVGSMAARGGVERFDVIVGDGSWLSALASTNNALRMITVTEAPVMANRVGGENYHLYIGDWEGHADRDGLDRDSVADKLPAFNPLMPGSKPDIYPTSTDAYTWVDAAQLLTAKDGSRTGDQAGLIDVAVFDVTASKDGARGSHAYTGDINIAAKITAASYDKYLKQVDGGTDAKNAPMEGYDRKFTYITDQGDDVVNMTVNGAIAADNDFGMEITTGAGNDLVAFRYENMTVNQAYDQRVLANLEKGLAERIDTGDGNDHVWFFGSSVDGTTRAVYQEGLGSIIVDAGAGNDRVYGNQTERTDNTAVLVFNAENGATVLDNGIEGATLGNDALTLGTRWTMASTTAGNELWVTVNVLGHAASYKVKTLDANSTQVSAIEINRAIERCVETDTHLDALVAAKDAAGHALLVESLIDGPMDVDISFQVKNAAGNFSEYTTDFAPFYAVSDEARTPTGATSSQIVVNAGAGGDVIVLGNNGMQDLVVLEGVKDDYNVIANFDVTKDTISLAKHIGGADFLGVRGTARIVADHDDKVTVEVSGVSGLQTKPYLVLAEGSNGDGNNFYTVVKVNGGTVSIFESYELLDGVSLSGTGLPDTLFTTVDVDLSGKTTPVTPPTPPAPEGATKGENLTSAVKYGDTFDASKGAFAINLSELASSPEDVVITIDGLGIDDTLVFSQAMLEGGITVDRSVVNGSVGTGNAFDADGFVDIIAGTGGQGQLTIHLTNVDKALEERITLGTYEGLNRGFHDRHDVDDASTGPATNPDQLFTVQVMNNGKAENYGTSGFPGIEWDSNPTPPEPEGTTKGSNITDALKYGDTFDASTGAFGIDLSELAGSDTDVSITIRGLGADDTLIFSQKFLDFGLQVDRSVTNGSTGYGDAFTPDGNIDIKVGTGDKGELTIHLVDVPINLESLATLGNYQGLNRGFHDGRDVAGASTGPATNPDHVFTVQVMGSTGPANYGTTGFPGITWLSEADA